MSPQTQTKKIVKPKPAPKSVPKRVDPKSTLKNESLPILEFDFSGKPIITAKNIYTPQKKVTRCLITYFRDVVDKYYQNGRLNSSLMLRTDGLRPCVYEMRVGEEHIYVMLTSRGGPSAANALECLASMGVKKFMVAAGAGTLDADTTQDKILIPTSAIREDGTSYQYLPAAREIAIDPKTLKRLEKTLTREKQNFMPIKTWTVDGIFATTQRKAAARLAEGCLAVDMECASFYAVAKARKLILGEIMFAGDLVRREGWEYQIWHSATDLRENMFDIGVKCLMSL